MKFIKSLLVLALSLGIVFLVIPNLYADETSEAILKLLIKKGIISQEEVDAIKAEVKKEAAKSLEERVEKLEKEVPSWVKDFKLKGDLRLRNENITEEHGSDTNRQRIRFRVGAETKINDLWKLGFGLGTGSSSRAAGQAATSTNQTLEQEFESKPIWLDYAYIEYTPFEWATLIGGKFKSPFFHTDMMWDSDIRFDGVAARLSHELINDIEGFLTAGYFPIDERGDEADLFLMGYQGGLELNFADFAKLKTAVTYYDYRNTQGYPLSTLVYEKGTNTADSGKLAYGFKIINPTTELTFNNPFGIGFPVALISDFAFNHEATDDTSAWRTGLKLGKKVKDKGDWTILGQYTHIQSDALLDIFSDADFNSGGTNAKGWEVILDYGLFKNVILSLDYYNTQTISGAESDEEVLQADIIVKF